MKETVAVKEELKEKISVVLPTYNTPVPLLREAVDSILNQTFRDFEFIIVDDGSTNESVAYLEGLTDPRVRLIRNESNIGITKSLNIGFRAAQGKYIARMDADDFSVPERFEKQLAFMESHPDAIVCGSNVMAVGWQPVRVNAEMEDMESYRVRMLFMNPGPPHPTAFLDREKLNQHRIQYDEQLIYAQDYGLWRTVSQYGRVCILPEVLVYRQDHPDRITVARRPQQIQCDKMTQRKLLEQLLGAVTAEELDLHYYYSTGLYREAAISPQIAQWYDRLMAANDKKLLYDRKKLKDYIVKIKTKLIEQTFTKDMSKAEKVLLYFRYLPFSNAAKINLHVIFGKLLKK